jgi:hypothetical protein
MRPRFIRKHTMRTTGSCFVSAGAGRDGGGDMETLCRFKGGEKVKGLADGRTEAIQ